MIFWKGISYALLGLAAISGLLMALALINPKRTFRFWKLQSMKSLTTVYMILAIVFLVFGSIARDASLSPEELAVIEASQEARRAEREKNAAEKKARKIEDLLAEVRAISSSDLQGNLEGYKRLAKYEPDNPKFKSKVIHYQKLVDQNIAEVARIAEAEKAEKAEAARIAEAERAEAARIAEAKRTEAARIAEAKRREQARAAAEENVELARREKLHGEKPLQSAWDNGVPIVKRYLQSIANDPGSIKYEGWWPLMYSEKNGWFVKCDWRAKNGFGAYVRSVDGFYIRFGRVVETRK